MYKLLPLFLSLLLLTACGGNTNNDNDPLAGDSLSYNYDDTGEMETTPLDNQDLSVLLRYKFNKGTSYSYRITSQMETDQKVVMPDTSINQQMTHSVIHLLKVSVIDIDPDSIIETEVTVTSVKVDGKANNKEVHYESRTMNDSVSKSTFSEYAALVNNPFRVRISSTGEITEISRVDRIVNEFLRIKGYQDSVSTSEKEMLRRDMSEGMLRPILINIFRSFPETAVAKDSQWTIPQPPSPVMSYTMQNTYVYKVEGLEEMNNQKLAVLNAGVTSVFTGSNQRTEQGVTYTFEKPKTEAEGKIYFNVDRGVVQRSRTETISTISFTMEATTPTGKERGKRSEIAKVRNIVELLN